MAISVVQYGSNVNASGTVAVTLTGVTAGSTLVALAYSFNDVDFTISSNNGGAFTKDLDYYKPATYATAAFSLKNVASGSHTVTLSGGTTNSMLFVVEVAGLSTTAPYDTGVGGTGSTAYHTIAGPTSTTTVANAILISFVHKAAGTTFTDPTGWTGYTKQTDATYGRDGEIATKIVSATGTYTADWGTNTTGQGEAIIVVYKEAGGGGGGGARRICAGIVG